MSKQDFEFQIKKIAPESIEELMAVSCLNNNSVKKFFNAKFSEIREYEHALLEPVLKETYGKIIYQEQIIQILHILGDFSLAHADIIRRLMLKEATNEYYNRRDDFIESACNKNMNKTDAKLLWEHLSNISKDCRMKAHQISFVLMSYCNLYLLLKNGFKQFNGEENYEKEV